MRSREEHSTGTQNKTDYRNQINKVANSIKEIIESIARPGTNTYTKEKSKIPVTASSGGKKSLIALIVITVVLLAGYFIYSKLNTAGGSDESFEKSIAVLPFSDMTPESDMGYLGDGIAEEIINSLASIKSLKVIGRTSSFQFKGDKLDLRAVGEKLQVGIVLEGSVRKFKDHFRITAQLVRTDNGVSIWSERYDLDQTNLFKIQDNIAANVAERLRLTLSTMEKNTIVKKEIDPDAYTLFLKGLYQYKKFNFKECIQYEEDVIKVDSTYAPALALIGLAKTWLINLSHNWYDSVAINEALRFSQRAIKFDPNLAEGYSAIALISWSIQDNFPKARIYFDKSIELNPASALILNRYGYFLTWMGDFKRAEKLAKTAMRIDPVDRNSYDVLYAASMNSGHISEATRYNAEWKRIFGADLTSVTRDMDLALASKDYKSVLVKSDSLRKNTALLPEQLSILARSYFHVNRLSECDKTMTQLRSEISSGRDNIFFELAVAYAAQNKVDSCFKYLAISQQRREDHFRLLKIKPELQMLRSDPRYIKLYSERGFDKY